MRPAYDIGFKSESLEGELYLSDRWDVEKNKSSEIKVIPESGLIRKIKDRRLDKTLYEVFSTLFVSELLKKYSEVLVSRDFTLYSPKALRMIYGDLDKEKSFRSEVYEIFCPGKPLSHIKNSREKSYSVDGKEVRVEDRIMYLVGVLSEVFLREGVMHGDPQLRHLLLLPKEGILRDIDSEGNYSSFNGKNGLGVIDCENTLVEGAYSAEVRKNVNKFIHSVYKKFPTPNSEGYFEKGADLVRVDCSGFSARDIAYNTSEELFKRRFSEDVKKIDLEKGKVIFN